MNNEEARTVLHEYLKQYRARSYDELVGLLDNSQTIEVLGPSGANYQIEVQAFWDDRLETNLRVRGAIDDGGWRAFMPLHEEFIIAPSGVLIGE